MAVDLQVARDVAPVTPSDTLYAHLVGLYVGGAGNVAVETSKGTTVTLIGVGGGSLLPLAVRRVLATGTTATNIVGLKP